MMISLCWNSGFLITGMMVSATGIVALCCRNGGSQTPDRWLNGSRNTQYMSMIIPSRWFAGGKGLDSFRKEMLNDKRIRKIVDYENYKDVFPGLGGLAGGACYFLWDRDHPGTCEVTNKTADSEVTAERVRNEYEIFLRSNNVNITLRRSRLSGVARATLPDKQSHLVINYCIMF